MTPARPESPRLAWWLFASGVALYLLLSAPTLDLLGIAYEAPGGIFFEKMHPGTWLIVLACLVALPAHGHPIRAVGEQLRAEPLLAAYLVCVVCVIGWSLSRHGVSGAAFMLDTLLMPVVCVATVLMFDRIRQHRCLVIILTLLVVNTLLGLGEALTQTRLIPLRLGGADEIIDEVFRPSALLGHPLTNSIITATLIPAVLYLHIPVWRRVLLILLLWIGTLAFGGRTGFVLSTVVYLTYLLSYLVRSTMQGRFSYLQLTGGGVVGLFGSAMLALAIVASGIGDRIFKSLTMDASAAVRFRVWSLFDYLSGQDMLIGISPDRIANLSARIGLGASEAVENFWLLLFLQLGWIGFVPFVMAMALLFVWCWKNASTPMRLATLVFFAVASSNNSLATKTVAVTMLTLGVATTRPAGQERSALPN
jgi:hypothetical protein